MNGYDATRAIRNLKTDYALNVPIVAMTANAFKEDIDATYKCGMNGHITKPMSSDALYSILYRLLSQISDREILLNPYNLLYTYMCTKIQKRKVDI